MKLTKKEKVAFIKMVFNGYSEALRGPSEVIRTLPHTIYLSVVHDCLGLLKSLPKGIAPSVDTIHPASLEFDDLRKESPTLSHAVASLLRRYSYIDPDAFKGFIPRIDDDLSYASLFVSTRFNKKRYPIPFRLYATSMRCVAVNIGHLDPILEKMEEIIEAERQIGEFSSALAELADAIRPIRTTNGLRRIVPELEGLIDKLEEKHSETNLPVKRVSCETLSKIGVKCKE